MNNDADETMDNMDNTESNPADHTTIHNHQSAAASPMNPDDIRELIIVPKHGTPDDIERVLNQISKVCNALVSRILIGSVKESVTIGAANPIVQQVFQCAASSGTALAMLKEQRRQTSPLLVPQMGQPRMGRA